MKHFKNLSLIATLTLTFLISSCAGITDANLAGEPDQPLNIEARDMQDQSDIIESKDEEPTMIRVQPD